MTSVTNSVPTLFLLSRSSAQNGASQTLQLSRCYNFFTRCSDGCYRAGGASGSLEAGQVPSKGPCGLKVTQFVRYRDLSLFALQWCPEAPAGFLRAGHSTEHTAPTWRAPNLTTQPDLSGDSSLNTFIASIILRGIS